MSDSPLVEGLRYPPKQYESSACNGLGTAGGVCPAVLLPCHVSRLPWDGGLERLHDCMVQPLPGFGFNPTVVHAPSGMRRALRSVLPQLRFVATSRFEQNNKLVHCRNPAVRADAGRDRTREALTSSGGKKHAFGSTELLLLDRSLSVLQRMYIYGGECVSGRWRVGDGRLLVVNRTLWMSYYNAWGSLPPDKHCRGYWMAKLHVTAPGHPVAFAATASTRASRPLLSRSAHAVEKTSPVAKFVAMLKGTEESGGMGINGKSTQPLTAKRNGGVITSPSGEKITHELADVAPVTHLHTPEGEDTHHAVPESFGTGVHHNSINPIWVHELGAYLGVSHRHYHSGTTDTGKLLSNAVFQYGYAYRHVFFTLKPPSMSIHRHSRELCLPSLDVAPTGGNRSGSAIELCEGIQYLIGAFRPSQTRPSISFTYGVQVALPRPPHHARLAADDERYSCVCGRIVMLPS
mgnify:CR=1 FL=1|jgi:hypothetical protein